MTDRDHQRPMAIVEAFADAVPAPLLRRRLHAGVASIVAANARVTTEFGFPEATWIAEPGCWPSMIDDVDRERVLAAIAAAELDASCITEYQVVDGAGNRRWVRDEATLLDRHGDESDWVVVLSDITAIRAARAAVTSGMNRFQQYLDASPSLDLMFDGEGRFTFANERIRTWFGVDPMWVVGKTPHDWMPEGAATAMMNRVRKVLRTGVGDELEERVRTVAGGEIDLLTLSFPLASETGEPMVGMVGFDFTERRRSNSREQLLMAIVASADEAIVVRSLDGTIMSWNTGAERLTGFAAADVLRHPMLDLLPESEWESNQEVNRRVINGERPGLVETKWRRKDGSEIDVAYTVAPLKDASDTIFSTVLIARDFAEVIRGRRALREANVELEERVVLRTEELSSTNERLAESLIALRKNADLLRQQSRLLELAHDAIIVLNAEQVQAQEAAITYWNDGAERLLGWSTDEAIGTSVGTLMAPNLFPLSWGEVLETLNAVGHWEGTFTVLSKDGSRLPIDSRWTLQKNAFGDPQSILTMSVDARVRLDRERERQELAQQQRELLARAEEQARLAGELVNLKDDFATFIAHDMVTPAAAIKWYAEMLRLEDLKPEERSKFVGTILNEVEILLRLTDDVRFIARADTNEFPISPKPVAVLGMMEDALFYAQSRGGSHPVALEFTATGNVYADKDRIGQVLRNLIKNATKYTPPGSAITLRAEDVGDKVRMAVIDAGPGIDEVEAASIFEKYKRGRQSEERRVAGAGIGLYVSRQILQAHGQDLHLDSRMGEGSTFWFDLSRTAEAISANRTLGA